MHAQEPFRRQYPGAVFMQVPNSPALDPGLRLHVSAMADRSSQAKRPESRNHKDPSRQSRSARLSSLGILLGSSTNRLPAHRLVRDHGVHWVQALCARAQRARNEAEQYVT
jgi:hypothetical protein